ncbi:2OG-Fe(II) oxygenase superfamily protein [Duganella sp. CF458]|uniref:2OG-Fe(II) oxygenase family protein n=1 Tax=Duganella sp. CF458 TaxID=1884368 RepID=UPI0008F367B7|nr:2OG-Fe(II) oxygenase [Duganella sp. CF458]SFG39718.1 2OG-Fe(II) oxygenase superfamily protein [Duganella sp. CF458]
MSETNIISSPSEAWEAVRPRFGPGIVPLLPRRRGDAQVPPSLPGDWSEWQQPYRHFRANHVLDAESYAALCAQFSRILDTTAGKREGKYKMRPAMGNNDGWLLGLTDDLAASFAPLFTEAWLRSLAELLELKFLPRIEGALHSNPQGSRTGWIHTDCCSAWFDESNSTPERLMLPPRGRCSYFTGKAKARDAQPVEYVRAATMIFYLCNDGWQQGDGGETGIYNLGFEGKDTVETLIPPLNNSLFLFECSPHSFHRFVTNPGRTRNSIILWLHASVEDAEARWGKGINRKDQR